MAVWKKLTPPSFCSATGTLQALLCRPSCARTCHSVRQYAFRTVREWPINATCSCFACATNCRQYITLLNRPSSQPCTLCAHSVAVAGCLSTAPHLHQLARHNIPTPHMSQTLLAAASHLLNIVCCATMPCQLPVGAQHRVRTFATLETQPPPPKPSAWGGATSANTPRQCV